MLVFEVEGTFGCLISSLKIFNRLSSFLRRESLDLEVFSLTDRKFDLKESLSLGSDFSSPY